MRLKPKKEEIPYLFAIIITSVGIIYNFFPLSISTILILFGIDSLLWICLLQISKISKIENLLEKKKFFIDRKQVPSLSERLGTSKKSIWILGRRFSTLISTHFSLLEREFNKGREIRILMLNPKKIGSKIMSDLSPDLFKKQIHNSLEIISKYIGKRSERGGTILCRLLPFDISYGLFIIDGNELEGNIKVEMMIKGTDPSEYPNVIITRKESKRYSQLLTHFTELWKISDPIPNFKGKYL